MRIILTALLVSAAAPAFAEQSLISTTTVTVEQVYATKNLRDPLLPATAYGDTKGRGPAAKGAQPAVAASSFTIYNLALTGIMEDSRGRLAFLRDTASGALYMLRSGRITDSKNKPVPGVSGVVKGKQVVLMTDDKKVNQLSLREKSEQAPGSEK